MTCSTISIVLKIQALYHQHFLLSGEALSDGQITFFTCFLAKTRLIQTNIDCTSTIGKIFKRTLNNLMKISLLDLSYVNTLVVVEVQYLQQTNILQIPFIGPGLFLRGSSSRLWLLTSQPWFWWLRWLMAL